MSDIEIIDSNLLTFAGHVYGGRKGMESHMARAFIAITALILWSTLAWSADSTGFTITTPCGSPPFGPGKSDMHMHLVHFPKVKAWVGISADDAVDTRIKWRYRLGRRGGTTLRHTRRRSLLERTKCTGPSLEVFIALLSWTRLPAPPMW